MKMLRKNSLRTKVGLKCLLMLILVLSSLALFLFACDNGEDEQQTAVAEKQLYTCGMDPQVIQEGPGNCPICGMKLTPLKVETAAAVDRDQNHVQSDQSDHDAMAMNVDQEKSDIKKDKKIRYWRAPMDPTYISDKPGKSPMGMDLIPVYEGEEVSSGPTIAIDPETVQNMGVRPAEVRRQPFYRIIRTVGHIDYNEEALYTVSLKFDGWIEKLFVNRTGELVRRGQSLFTIYSPELVTTQEEYLLAYKNQQKLSISNFQEVSLSAKNLLAATRQRLKYWDITDKQIAKLEETGEVSKTLTIYSPANGIVETKNAIEGAYVKAGADLFQIADLSQIWVLAHIFEYEVPWIKTGQKVHMELPYIPGKSFEGRVDYIYPYLDSKTRDVKIRLVFDNPDQQLKPQMYANIMIESMAGQDELVIPGEAIVRSGRRNLVFLALGDGKFQPRDVIIGPEGEDGLVKVVSGLKEGEQIVTSAQFLLDSESRLREAIQKLLQSKTRDSQQNVH